MECYQCRKCKKYFASSQNLRVHEWTNKKCGMITKDGHAAELRCLFCQKTFHSYQGLLYHAHICRKKKETKE